MSFEELNNKLSPTIKRIAYKLNGHYRSFSHDDLYQEAILHLWNAFRKGKIGDKTDSYILQGCYFHLKNYIRKINERPNVISLDSLVNKEGMPILEEKMLLHLDGVEDIRENLDSMLTAETIQNNGFDPREKRILMFLRDGLTTRDIGKRIGISHVMVVKIISKLRDQCKKYIY